MDLGKPSADTSDRLSLWQVNGFVRVDGFISNDQCSSLLAATDGLLKAGGDARPVRFEGNLPSSLPSKDRISKLYAFHRTEPFLSLCTSDQLLAQVRPLFPGDIDVFLSQVVWKLPGAPGQPWHQDSSIFPFDPPRPVVAAWIALTPANHETSCLWIKPGSHLAELAPHVRNRNGPTAGRYFELTDQDSSDSRALVMEPGDLALFDSHLAHRSGDNVSAERRVALCFHYASSGTADRTLDQFGTSPFNDWMPAFRAEHPPERGRVGQRHPGMVPGH